MEADGNGLTSSNPSGGSGKLIHFVELKQIQALILLLYSTGCCAPTQTMQSCGSSTKTAIAGCCAPTQSRSTNIGDLSDERMKRIQDVNLNEFVGSYQIYAIKPGEQ